MNYLFYIAIVLLYYSLCCLIVSFVSAMSPTIQMDCQNATSNPISTNIECFKYCDKEHPCSDIEFIPALVNNLTYIECESSNACFNMVLDCKYSDICIVECLEDNACDNVTLICDIDIDANPDSNTLPNEHRMCGIQTNATDFAIEDSQILCKSRHFDCQFDCGAAENGCHSQNTCLIQEQYASCACYGTACSQSVDIIHDYAKDHHKKHNGPFPASVTVTVIGAIIVMVCVILLCGLVVILCRRGRKRCCLNRKSKFEKMLSQTQIRKPLLDEQWANVEFVAFDKNKNKILTNNTIRATTTMETANNINKNNKNTNINTNSNSGAGPLNNFSVLDDEYSLQDAFVPITRNQNSKKPKRYKETMVLD